MFGVAYNPYLLEKELKHEENNLKRKLATGIVKSVWLQFGTDIDKLEKGVRKIKSIEHQLKTSLGKKKINHDISIYGSIFIPTPVFLEKFRVRPWKGVYCSKEYLKSEESSINFSKQLLNKYQQLKVTPLVESSVVSEIDEEYFWKVYDQEKFMRRLNFEIELENMKDEITREELIKATNMIQNTTLES